MALAGRALSLELARAGSHPDPFAVSAYYLSAASPGPATLRTEVLRTGRSRLHRAGGPVPAGRRRRRRGAGPRARDVRRPGQRSRTRCAPAPYRRTCRRRTVACVRPRRRRPSCATPRCSTGWTCGSTRRRRAGRPGEPSGLGQIRGWLRLADGREPDPLMLLLAADALPPVAFDLGLSGWTPTLELTVHVRARPAPGWLRIGADHPQRGRRAARGGRRGVGLRRPARGPVAPARAGERTLAGVLTSSDRPRSD